MVVQSSLSNREQTYATVEGMTPVKKTLEKVEAEENSSVKKQNDFEEQLTQLEATFRLDKVLNINSLFEIYIFFNYS
jgi:hypothetical protein